jgi:hypothetical protein
MKDKFLKLEKDKKYEVRFLDTGNTSTGIEFLDELFSGGIRPNELTTVIASPNMNYRCDLNRGKKQWEI